MKKLLTICSLLAVVTVSRAIPRAAQSGPTASPEQSRAMVNTYCTGCHNTRGKAGGLALDMMNFDAVANDAQVWE
jgi:hypothetical protein